MKFLKILSVMILIVAAILIIFLYVLPSKYEISSSVVIDEPQAVTFDFISNPEKMKLWWPFTVGTNNADLTLIKSSNNLGSGIKWSANKVIKSGEFICTNFSPYDSLIYSLKVSDNKVNALSRFTFDENNNKTTVKWTLTAKLPFFYKWMYLSDNLMKFSDSMLKGLVELKKQAEKVGYINIQIEQTEIPDGQMLLVIHDSLPDNKDEKIIKNSQSLAEYELFNYITNNKLELAGPPIKVIYPDNEKYVFDIAVPIIFKPNLKTGGRIRLMQRFGGPVVLGTYKGPSQNLPYAYKIMDSYIKKHKINVYGYYWEENLNATATQDKESFIKIYFPIKR